MVLTMLEKARLNATDASMRESIKIVTFLEPGVRAKDRGIIPTHTVFARLPLVLSDYYSVTQHRSSAAATLTPI